MGRAFARKSANSCYAGEIEQGQKEQRKHEIKGERNRGRPEKKASATPATSMGIDGSSSQPVSGY